MEKKPYDDEYVSRLNAMPRHQLSHDARNRVLAAIREQDKTMPVRRPYKYAWVLAACVLLLAGVLFSGFLAEEKPATEKQMPVEKVETSQGGVYFERKDRAGEPIPEKILGIPNKIGLLGLFEDWVALDSQNTAKVFVYMWGEPGKLVDESIKVVAEHTRTGEKVTIANGTTSSPIDQEDAAFLTSFAPLPYAGVWNLHFIVAEEPFADFSVTVQEPFPQTEKMVIRRMADEFKVNETETTEIVLLKGEMPETIDVRLKSLKTGEEKIETFTNSEQYNTAGDTPYYWGALQFPEKGEWSITVLGETVHVNVQ